MGNELADGLGDGDGLGLGAVTPGTVALDVALGVWALGVGALGALALGVWALGALALGALVLGALVLGAVVPGALVLGVPPEVVAPGVPLAETAGVAGPVPPGEKDGGFVDGEPDEHADTDAEASMAKAAQPRTAPRKRRQP